MKIHIPLPSEWFDMRIEDEGFSFSTLSVRVRPTSLGFSVPFVREADWPSVVGLYFEYPSNGR